MTEASQLAVPPRPLSVEDWLDLDVDSELGKRIELLGGGLIIMAPPVSGHAMVISQLMGWLLRAGFEPDRVLAGVGLITGAATARIPDLVLLRELPSAAVRAFYADAVVLTVEVVSPSTAAQDRRVKPDEYAAAGVEWFWRVEGAKDPDTAMVYRSHRLRGVLDSLPLRAVLADEPVRLLGG
jgi:Uma2 family endonuclease